MAKLHRLLEHRIKYMIIKDLLNIERSGTWSKSPLRLLYLNCQVVPGTGYAHDIATTGIPVKWGRNMTQIASPFDEVISQLRHLLPADTATAHAIDQHEPWERVALKAIEDGYIDAAEEFVRFVEACVRRSM